MSKTISEKFESHFSEENLKNIFSEKIVFSRASGIDCIDPYKFRERLDKEIGIASRKVKSGTYKFTKYKLKLISKGRDKPPREISIPTVRDRVVLRALCDFLVDVFGSSLNMDLPQNVVKSVKRDLETGGYDKVIKLDVTNFYPSIKHGELISRLGQRISAAKIKDLIHSAITTPTVASPREHGIKNKRGVPQGLSISNILAAIYLLNIDRRYNKSKGIKYYRYVDDILILSRNSYYQKTASDVIQRFQKIGLTIYDPKKRPDKSSINDVNKEFDYLGYKFIDTIISTRVSTIEKLKDSIAGIFTSYNYSKNKSKEFLLWRLNLRITGCVFENKSKGWLFFFSEINDEPLLHLLDHYTKRLCKRFSVEIKPKRFVRAFKEIKHNKYETNYVPNFDKYELEDKKNALVKYFGLNLDKYQDIEIEYEFHKRIDRQVKELEVDVADFS